MFLSVVDRYVAWSFMTSYLILVVILAALYVGIDLLVNIDEFTENRSLSLAQVLTSMADFYGYNLPLYYAQVSGPAMSLAAAFTLGSMLRHRELTLLVAAGVPLQRLIAPIILCAILLIGAWIANRELLIPPLADKIARTHDETVSARAIAVNCARDPSNAILTAMRLYPAQARLEQVYIIEPGPDGLPATLIEADAAVYDHEQRTWRLTRGRKLAVADANWTGEERPVRYDPIETFAFGLTPAELKLRQSAEWAELLSLRDMNTLLRASNLPNQSVIEMGRHVRLTFPLLQCVLLLLTMPFFLTCEPINVVTAGGRALLVGGSFFAVGFMAHEANVDGARAALIAWTPILIFGPIAAVSLANVRT